MFARKKGKDYYLICRGRGRKLKRVFVKDFFFVKEYYTGMGYISNNGLIYFPPELIGKRIRLRVEVIKNERS